MDTKTQAPTNTDTNTDTKTEHSDQLYAKKQSYISDFHFGRATAIVFDDMLERSVPFYAEIQRMMGEMAADHATPGSKIYDLGCSTGTTLAVLDQTVPAGVTLVGVDDSAEMLERARQKLEKLGMKHAYNLVQQDLNNAVTVKDASVVIMNLTLQFVRPLHRQQLMASIAAGMKPNSCLLLVEKVLSANSMTNRHFINHYYNFKQRNGYSQMEISQKREALENVLVPYRTEENIQLLLNSGFSDCEVFFKWYNFCGYIAHVGAAR